MVEPDEAIFVVTILVGPNALVEAALRASKIKVTVAAWLPSAREQDRYVVVKRKGTEL